MALNILEALQAPFQQDVEAVERSASATLHSGNVDEIDPPDDIDELHHDIYEQVGIVASNIDQYVQDVFEPGVRIEADNESTETFFQEEFLPQCGVVGGEKRQPFEAFAPTTETQRLTRGTALVNLIPNDQETAIPDTEVSGFYHIPPETVTCLTEEHKNILLPPDQSDLPVSVSEDEVEMTRRGEVAAYAQFDDESILGRRRNGFDEDTVYFSQSDIAKATYSLDIGGDGSDETGIWGRSILRPIKEEAEEYEQAKRDRAAAIKTKAHGIWIAKFDAEVLEFPDGTAEVREWNDADIDSVMSELEGMGPGDVLELEGPIEPDQWEGEVPEVGGALSQLVDDILAPLPAPKYAVGFETDINQFVTETQETRYEQTIQQARNYHEHFWTNVFETVAESHGLDAGGLQVRIEPESEESPVMSLSDEQIERMKTWAEAYNQVRGDVPSDMAADMGALRELILQLPEDAAPQADTSRVDEDSEEVRDMAEDLEARFGEIEADD